MFCPISLRLSELIQTDPKKFLLESSRLEYNWLLCRLLVVFAGNLLTIIYGLLIIIWIYWCNWGLHSDESYQKILSNAYNAGVFIVIIGSYGCASIFIKRYSLVYTLINISLNKIINPFHGNIQILKINDRAIVIIRQ